MAAFSLGKLDAICARLKSTQQSHTVSPHWDQAKKVAVKSKEDWDKNDISTEGGLDLPTGVQSPNGCAENVAREKIKIAAESTPPSSSENHIVSINTKNNNNNVEATDYNEIAHSSSPSCSTFQTADSTTADTLVSSTTGDNSLTNHGGTWDTFISNLTVQQPESLIPTAAQGSNIDPQGSLAADKGQLSGCESNNCIEAENSAGNHDVTSSSTYTLPSLKTVDTFLSSDPPLCAQDTGEEANTDSNTLDNETPVQKTDPNCTSTEAEPDNKLYTEPNCTPEQLHSNVNLAHQSDILSLSFSSLPSTGRRKSRKAAKPQKQAKDNFFLQPLDDDLEINTPDKCNNLCDKSLVLKESLITDKRVGAFSKEDVPISLHTSSAVDNIFVEKKLASEIDHSSGDNIVIRNAVQDITNEIEKKNVTHEVSKTPFPPLDLTDSKGLVDYAQNTMKELLGIYGFEGSESRNVLLQSFQNSPEEKSTFPEALETVYAPNKEALLKDSLDRSDESGSDNTESSGKKLSSSKPSPSKDNANLNGSATTRKMLPELFTSIKSLSGKKKPYIHKPINSAEFSKLIKRYGTGSECGGKLCQDLGYRDHYHCLDCPHKVFIRKEEMLRHYKWHKKRQDSLQHGFMRYSPTDDCSKKYGNCAHNGRQTHYHCVQNGCDKVYVSTSDVQMHANFHRKDSAIIQEGFQRFRATEDCGTSSCAFHGQRTTHFHCRRPQCHFTFKNKADMEKHKSYHQKDEMLSRDGFKKFMKYEVCQYSNCRYSKTSNHIHCIRPGCQYVLHSSTQLYSHKRKHERRDFEFAYRNYRHLQQQQSPKSKSKKTDLNTLPVEIKPAVVENNVKDSSPVIATPTLPVQPILVNIPSPSIEADTAMNLSSQRAESLKMETEAQVDLPINLALEKEQPTTQNKKQATLNREPPPTPYREQPATLKELTALNTAPPAPCVKMEADAELEPQDLSIKCRLPNFLEASFDANGYQIEPIPLCKKEVKEEAPSGASGYVCGNDEVIDDEDDDDDDDDKDYGLYEEPILVNLVGVEQTNMSLNTEQIKEEALTIKSEVRQPCEANGNSAVCPENPVQACKTEIISPTSQEALPDSNILIKPFISQTLSQKLAPSERRERDESWKKYLTRYTANDACHSRCSCLYKDHYHCRVEGCQVIFKSKDGVRGHARFHDVQDNLTPLVFRYFTGGTACHIANCQFDQKESHYHCNWTNCTHAISSSAPTFARLEHYRIHDYATTYVGKCRNTFFGGNKVELDPLHKRRGRPPKYPKYDLPMVPKVHLTEKEITDSTIAFMHNRCSENSRIINGFKKFVCPELCPDDKCLYKGNDHYHCGRKFCHMSTDRLDVLNVHAKEFHNNITILEGYEFFERMVNCRRPVCHNNRINRHFHCVRSKCDYSFVRHSTMAQHNKKHPTVTSAVLSTPITRPVPLSSVASDKSTSSSYVPIAPAVTSPLKSPPPVLLKPIQSNYKNTIKSSGTYYPVPGLSKFKLTPVPTSKANIKTSGVKTVKTNQATASPSVHPGVNSIFSQNGVCLTLSPIPLLAQTSLVHQTNVLTGIIPVELTQQNLRSQLVNISGNHFLANSQGKYLMHSEFLGSKMLQLVQSTPSASCSPSTASSVQLANQLSPVLLQTKQEVPCNWPNLKKSMNFSVQLSCGRPFCKLKKKDHYHCLDCNQAFSDPARLRTHLSKHGFKFQKSKNNARVPKALELNMASRLDKEKEMLSDSEDTDDLVNSSLNLQPSVFANMVAAPLKNQDVALVPILNGNSEPVGDSGKEKTCLIGNDNNFLDTSSLSIDEESSESSLNVSSSSLTLCSSLSSQRPGGKRSLESEVDTPEPKRKYKSNSEIPGGYKRVRCGEDCGHIRCAYRQTVTHFHCTRANCGYGFSDKLRIMQHRVRHERLDALMGNEFQQFRASVSCARSDCEFNERASHFHCLKCLFSCSDSSKVPAHRKYHAKQDKISSNGFLKYSGTSDCQIASCSYFRKQTHYHCTFSGCKHAVLGPSQMAAHKQKHVLGQSILQ